MENGYYEGHQAAMLASADSQEGLDGLLDVYRLTNQVEGKSLKTISWYQSMLGQFLEYLEQNQLGCALEALSINIVRGYVAWLQQKPRHVPGHTPSSERRLSPKTVQCHVRCLKAFASWLYRESYTPENRLERLRLPKAPQKLVQPLTPAEITKIVDCCCGSPVAGRNRAIVMLALDTGLRASEIAGLSLGQLNPAAGLIKVMGKGAKERIVPVGSYVQKVLKHYITAERPKPADVGIDNLFLSRIGRPITVNTIKLMFTRLAEKSGIRRLHAHLCRHTFATSYLLNGGDIFSLKGILGHTTFEMVNHYLHFTSSQITQQHHKYSPMDRLHTQK